MQSCVRDVFQYVMPWRVFFFFWCGTQKRKLSAYTEAVSSDQKHLVWKWKLYVPQKQGIKLPPHFNSSAYVCWGFWVNLMLISDSRTRAWYLGLKNGVTALRWKLRHEKLIYSHYVNTVLIGLSNQGEWDGWRMMGHARNILTGLKENDHLGDLDVDGRIILTWIYKYWILRYCTGFLFLDGDSSE